MSPSAGLSLSLDGGVTLYSNVGTAFETPTTTELANRPDGAGGFNPSLQPQRTVSYELGARRTRGQASAQFAVYRALVRDALIPFEVPDVPGRQFFRNAGLTATSGVEVAATAVVGRAVQLAASYTFTNPRFRSYTVGSAVLDGNLVPGVAQHRAELSGSWSVARHTLAADLRHQSRTVVDDANTAWSPGYTLADVRVAPRPFDGRVARVRLSFGVQNLFGAEYNSSVVVNAFGRRYFEPGPGRAFHVGLTAEHPGR